mgnify:FL=1
MRITTTFDGLNYDKQEIVAVMAEDLFHGNIGDFTLADIRKFCNRHGVFFRLYDDYISISDSPCGREDCRGGGQ